jgi:aminoglycoside 6'-N-acetyltransferase I
VVRGGGMGRARGGGGGGGGGGLGCREMASDAEVENVGSRAAHARCGYTEIGALIHFRKDLGR